MKCLIYTRVSTEWQTPENQISQLKEYALKQEWKIADVKIDICSGSKSADDRAGLKSVFEMARQRKFDVLRFWSLDRFSREGSRKTLEYLSRLDAYGVKWHSYTEEYTPVWESLPMPLSLLWRVWPNRNASAYRSEPKRALHVFSRREENWVGRRQTIP